MGTGSFLGVKRPGRGVDYPRLSRAEVEGRVELYNCSLSGPSWPVLRYTLPLIYLSPCGRIFVQSRPEHLSRELNKRSGNCQVYNGAHAYRRIWNDKVICYYESRKASCSPYHTVTLRNLLLLTPKSLSGSCSCAFNVLLNLGPLDGLWSPVLTLLQRFCVIRTNQMYFIFKFIPINILYMLRID